MERGYQIPLTALEFWLIVTLLAGAALYAMFHWIETLQDRAGASQRSPSERALTAMALLLAPFWAALIGFVLLMLAKIGATLFALHAGDEEMRWYAIGFGGLITGLLALVSAPLALIRVATTERQTRTAEQGHMTDRISKAVEQLGAEKTVKKAGTELTEPNLEVRIGGLLSLERIAQDSTAYDKGRDHVRVMEIICAYIRNNAPAKDAKVFGEEYPDLPYGVSADQIDAYTEQLVEWEEKHLFWLATEVGPPSEDIALALLILSRRSDRQRRIEAAHGQDGVTEAHWPFDDPCPVLPDPKADGSYPPRVIGDFQQRLDAWQRTLSHYHGYRPDLRKTCLQKAALSSYRLNGMRLDWAQMQGARLNSAKMQGARLYRAQMQGALLGEVQMQGASFDWAKMQGARLDRAQMQGARLNSAKMQGARLVGAQMQGALLSEAQMDKSTSLTDANFAGSALREVDYRSVSIAAEQVTSSFGDASVKLPFDNPAHWPDRELDWGQFRAEWHRFRADPENYQPPPRPAD